MKYQPDDLFRSTAPYYARYRAGYPPQLFTHLAERFGLDCTQLALDLGCGTGQIAIPLAAHVREVVAVDPEPSMLDEGRVLADQQGITSIDWRQGDSYHLTDMGLHDLALATMGASFHWMDRAAVLKTLDQITHPSGAVVVVSGGPPGRADKPCWDEIVTAVRTRWLGTERGRIRHLHPPTAAARGSPRRFPVPSRRGRRLDLDAGARPGLGGRVAVLLFLLRPRPVR